MSETRQITKYVSFDAFKHFWENLETYVLPKYIDVRDSELAAGTYYNVTVNENGIITAGCDKIQASKIDGVISVDNLPDAALERLVIVDDEDAMLALTIDDVQLGDTVKNNDTQIMYYVVDTEKLGTMDAFDEYQVGGTASVDWMNVKNKPDSMVSSKAFVVNFADETIDSISYDGSDAESFTIPNKLANPEYLYIVLPDNTQYAYDGSGAVTVDFTTKNVTDAMDKENEDGIDDIMKDSLPILQSIFINTNPTKTTYYQGDLFNPDGMNIIAIYSNGLRKNVTTLATYKIAPLVYGESSIEFTYTETELKTITKTCTVPIVVEKYAVDYYEISTGDVITLTHSTFGDMDFICVDKDHDGTGTATLVTKNIPRLMAFDAKEPTNTDENRRDYGNNRYRYSTIHQWLNSTKETNWFTKQHNADAAPTSDNVLDGQNPYVFNKGLLSGFANNLLDQLVTINKPTVVPTCDGASTVEDVFCKVFLLSGTEMGYGSENGLPEGDVYEYFNMPENRLAYPSSYCMSNTGGVVYEGLDTTKPWYYWLRTPYSLDSFSARVVKPDGTLDGSSVCNGDCGLRFAFVIKKYDKPEEE